MLHGGAPMTAAPAEGQLSPPRTRLRFLRQVLRLAGPYWRCAHCAKVRWATLLLLLLTIGQVGLSVWGNYWHRALYDALEQRSVRGVLVQVAVFALIVSPLHRRDRRAPHGQALAAGGLAGLAHRTADDQLAGRGPALSPALHRRRARQPGPAHRRGHPHRHGIGHRPGAFADLQPADPGPFRRHPLVRVRLHRPARHHHAHSGYMVPLAFLYAGLGSVFGWMCGKPLVRATTGCRTPRPPIASASPACASRPRPSPSCAARGWSGRALRGAFCKWCAVGTSNPWPIWALSPSAPATAHFCRCCPSWWPRRSTSPEP